MASHQMVGYRDLIGALGGSPRGGSSRYDDEIGDDLGDDLGLDDDLAGLDDQQLGAAVRRARGRNTGRGERIPANRIYDLGLGAQTVPAGGTIVLTGAPAIRFRVDRLYLVPTAPGLIVLDIKVGIVSQTVGGAGSPVESFGPQAVGSRMSGQTLDPAVPCTVLISNPTAAPIGISGNVIGKADQ